MSEESEVKYTPIDQPGKYDVTIRKPSMEALPEKDGDGARMQAVLPGVTADGKYIHAFLPFTRTLIQSGNNAGKPLFRVNSERIEALMPDGWKFHPGKIGELEGVNASFTVEWNEYQGQKRLQVAWVNPPYEHKPLSADEAASIWSQFESGSVSPAQAAPVAAKNDLPF